MTSWPRVSRGPRATGRRPSRPRLMAVLVAGWGGLPYISEFSPSGKLLFNAKLPPGVSTCRACLLPWHPAS
jgi:hypothetical protein